MQFKNRRNSKPREEVFYESCESNKLDDDLANKVSTGLDTVREAIETELEIERNT